MIARDLGRVKRSSRCLAQLVVGGCAQGIAGGKHLVDLVSLKHFIMHINSQSIMNTLDNLMADVVGVKRLYLKTALPRYLRVN